MMQRTCLDCGQTWLLEAGLAHLRPGSHGLTAGAVGGRLDSSWSDASAQLDQQLEAIRVHVTAASISAPAARRSSSVPQAETT
jgi:hypothetical protein